LQEGNMTKLKMLGIAGSMVGTMAMGGSAFAHEGRMPDARFTAHARFERFRERERERERERARMLRYRLHHRRVMSPWFSR
jgi:hypothetical protein